MGFVSMQKLLLPSKGRNWHRGSKLFVLLAGWSRSVADMLNSFMYTVDMLLHRLFWGRGVAVELYFPTGVYPRAGVPACLRCHTGLLRARVAVPGYLRACSFHPKGSPAMWGVG